MADISIVLEAALAQNMIFDGCTGFGTPEEEVRRNSEQ